MNPPNEDDIIEAVVQEVAAEQRIPSTCDGVSYPLIRHLVGLYMAHHSIIVEADYGDNDPLKQARWAKQRDTENYTITEQLARYGIE